MNNSFYSETAKKYNIDTRHARKVAHHPFEFFHERSKDPRDNRPIRFPYLGVFYVKPNWRKSMIFTLSGGFPEEDKCIIARVKTKMPNKKTFGVYLREGIVKNNTFISKHGDIKESKEQIVCWLYSENVIQ